MQQYPLAFGGNLNVGDNAAVSLAFEWCLHNLNLNWAIIQQYPPFITTDVAYMTCWCHYSMMHCVRVRDAYIRLLYVGLYKSICTYTLYY